MLSHSADNRSAVDDPARALLLSLREKRLLLVVAPVPRYGRLVEDGTLQSMSPLPDACVATTLFCPRAFTRLTGVAATVSAATGLEKFFAATPLVCLSVETLLPAEAAAVLPRRMLLGSVVRDEAFLVSFSKR